MKGLYILAEGDTEEIFVERVMRPYFNERLWIKVINQQGGFNQKYAPLHKTLWPLLRSAHGNRVTTLVDYYAFSPDGPGMTTRPAGSALDKVRHVQWEWKARYAEQHWFEPFLALHELEAWIFADPSVLPRRRGEPKREVEMTRIVQHANGPEAINDSPATSPSHRLEDLFTGTDSMPAYNKKIDGPGALADIGIPAIREKCPHFNSWLESLEAYANT